MEGPKPTVHSPELQGSTTAKPVMAPHIYELLDALPDTYWRYKTRHELFFNLWQHHCRKRSNYQVLDIGCGSGGLLAYLIKRAHILPVGVDLFSDTLPYCQRRGINSVSAADAIALPFCNNCFDFVIAQDVIEHIEDDNRALSEIHRVCAVGGMALILVPAFNSLWSTRDIRLHHYRRYTLDQIAQRVHAAGFMLIRSTYTDLFLLPLLKIAIAIAPRTLDGVADISVDSPGGASLINSVLLAISRIEAAFAQRIDLPFGVSAIILARK
jgi:ubiquinone/menaquinone biosynthesis C-methylase UbiE